MNYPFYLPPPDALLQKSAAVSVVLGKVLYCKDFPLLDMRVRVLELETNPDLRHWRLPDPPTSWLLVISGRVWEVFPRGTTWNVSTAVAHLLGSQVLRRTTLAESSEDALTAAVQEALPHDDPEPVAELSPGDKSEVEAYVESSKVEVDPAGDVLAEQEQVQFEAPAKKGGPSAPPNPIPRHKGGWGNRKKKA